MLAYGVIDLLLEPFQLSEGADAAQLTNALKVVASPANVDQATLGMHVGFVTKYLTPRIQTAQQKAQAAGVDPSVLHQRFTTHANIQGLAQQYFAQRPNKLAKRQQSPDADPNSVKSFSLMAAHNLANLMIQLSGEVKTKDDQETAQAKQQAGVATSAAAQAIAGARQLEPFVRVPRT